MHQTPDLAKPARLGRAPLNVVKLQPRLMRPYAHAPSLQRQKELLGLDRAIGKTSRASRCGLVQLANRAEHGSFMASQIQARTELGSARLVSSPSEDGRSPYLDLPGKKITYRYMYVYSL